jgi:hypothetical protein
MKTILEYLWTKKGMGPTLATLLLAIVLGGAFYFASANYRQDHVDAVKLVAAARTYAASFSEKGLPAPASVSVEKLVASGLLNEADVLGFRGMEVTVSLTDAGTRPQDVLVRARLADGHEIVALGDGSVQQLHK